MGDNSFAQMKQKKKSFVYKCQFTVRSLLERYIWTCGKSGMCELPVTWQNEQMNIGYEVYWRARW
jgi:hypothetical protein